MTHEERHAIARELADRILAVYGDAVLAIYITSSTAKGLDRAHSDLELTAVLRDGVDVEFKSYVHRGILIEIEYPQESRLLANARRVTRHWPIEADGYRSRLLLFEREGWTRRLDEAVAESDRADVSRALHLAATGLIEDRDKLRNAHGDADALNVRVQAIWVAYNAARLVLLLNRRWMTTTRRFYAEAFECPQRPPDFQPLVERLLGLVPATVDEVAATADRLTGDLLALVEGRGVRVESSALIV